MTPEQIVEATLFASQTPLTPNEIARADESLNVVVVTANSFDHRMPAGSTSTVAGWTA